MQLNMCKNCDNELIIEGPKHYTPYYEMKMINDSE